MPYYGYYRKRRFRKRPRARLWKVPSLQDPEHVFVRQTWQHDVPLTYINVFPDLHCTSAINFTSVYDPWTATGGESAGQFSELAAKYYYYRVQMACMDVDVHFTSTDTLAASTVLKEPHYLPVILCATEQSTAISDPGMTAQNLRNVPNYAWLEFTIAQLVLQPERKVRLRKWFNPGKIYNVKDPQDVEKLWGTFGSNPEDSLFSFIYYGPTRPSSYLPADYGIFRIYITINFWVHWWCQREARVGGNG